MNIKTVCRRIGVALVVGALLPILALAEVTTPQAEETEQAWQELPEMSAQIFSDVPEDARYAQAVVSLAQMGIITGDEKGQFNPESIITRAEMAAIVCRVMEVEEEAKDTKETVFSDVPATHWAVGYVAKAAQLGIINGYGDGKFGPANPVTYEQTVKMLVCAWGHEIEAQAEGGWPDGYMRIATQKGYTQGISQPSVEAINRGTAALLIYQSFEE